MNEKETSQKEYLEIILRGRHELLTWLSRKIYFLDALGLRFDLHVASWKTSTWEKVKIPAVCLFYRRAHFPAPSTIACSCFGRENLTSLETSGSLRASPLQILSKLCVIA